MKISAIVSIYNTPVDLMKQSLSSITDQQCTCDYEVILVDDGSEESIHQYLENFENNHTFCKLVTHEVNKGLSAARSTGMKNATGDCIFFPDSDDILLPGAIEQIYQAFLTCPEASFVSFGWIEEKQKGEKRWLVSKEAKSISQNEIYIALCDDSIFKGYVWNKVFNLTVMGKDLPPFDSSYKVFEDKIWLLNLGDKIKKAYLIPDILYVYKFNYSSITRSNESLRNRQFLYYEANEELVRLSQKFGASAYWYAIEYYFSLTWHDYFYWMFISRFNKNFMRSNALAVLRVLKWLKFHNLRHFHNKIGYILFSISYKLFRLGNYK